MVEYIREFSGSIKVDTNKQTYEFTVPDSTESFGEMLNRLRSWGVANEWVAEPQDAPADTPEPQPERWLTGTRTFARTIGTCPRCRGPVQAVLTVLVKVDLNEMHWNERGERPNIGASCTIKDSKTEHTCSDSEPDDEDEM